MKLSYRIKTILLAPVSVCNAIFRKRLEVLSIDETAKAIKEKSIARYGDGELSLMLGMGIKFQEKNSDLKKRLREIAKDKDNPNCIVAVPPIFSNKQISILKPGSQKWWKRNLLLTRGHWYRFFKNKTYYDSFISRFYLPMADKSDEAMHAFIELLKAVWEGKNILFVEGNKSRLGIGNDLFSNANSVRRILCPSENAYKKYDQILETALKNSTNDDLIICAIGPTATVLAYDLSKEGRHALDLGHIDIEYEWFRQKATTKVNIAGKAVAESKEYFVEDNSHEATNVIAVIE